MGKTITKEIRDSGVLARRDACPTMEERENLLVEQVDLNHRNWKTRHVAITMDGNGRWAKEHGFADRIRGHQAAPAAVRAVVETAAKLGLKALTLYAFSRENWKRPPEEVSALMHLLKRFLVKERPEMMENDIRFIASGCLEDLPSNLLKELDKTREMTRGNKGLTVNLAVSYSGREEIVHAARELARKVAGGELNADAITPDLFSQYLYAPELGDPDLFIRTSGENRISNFMLWQVAYSEIYVTDVYWPDFRRIHLLEAMIDFQKRQRRFGRIS